MAHDSRATMREVLADKLKGYEQFAPFVQMLLYDPREKLTKLLDASVQAGVDFAAAAVAAERERILQLLPGGTHCDPQQIADSIRENS